MSTQVDAETAEWSNRLAQGDPAALAEMYRRHSALALVVALDVLRDRAEAEDVVQQSFMQLWQRATHYQPERSSPATWIAQIVHSRALDRLRTLKARTRMGESFAAEPRVEAVVPADPVEGHRDAEMVRSLLEALPAEQSVVLKMAYFEGLSHSSIASKTGLPLGTVKTRIRLATFKLAEWVKEGLRKSSPGEAASPSTAR